jgi:SPP1 family predicted phage head-tail adaptor
MSLSNLYNVTATRKTKSAAQNSFGATAETWSGTTTIRCRIWPVNASERAMAGSTGVDYTHYAVCDYSTTIDEADRLVVGSTTYHVVGVGNAAGQCHHKKLTLREVKPDRGT